MCADVLSGGDVADGQKATYGMWCIRLSCEAGEAVAGEGGRRLQLVALTLHYFHICFELPQFASQRINLGFLGWQAATRCVLTSSQVHRVPGSIGSHEHSE